MKKRIIIIIAICFLMMLIIGVPIGIYVFTNKDSNSENIKSGIYKVVECKEYPDAYIVCKDNKIQLFNIDLNEIYRDEEYQQIKTLVESGTLNVGYTEEELYALSDYNEMFVMNAYEYDVQKDRTKEGTYTYVYNCSSDGNLFGLFFVYDEFNHTLKINNYQKTLLFELK